MSETNRSEETCCASGPLWNWITYEYESKFCNCGQCLLGPKAWTDMANFKKSLTPLCYTTMYSCTPKLLFGLLYIGVASQWKILVEEQPVKQFFSQFLDPQRIRVEVFNTLFSVGITYWYVWWEGRVILNLKSEKCQIIVILSSYGRLHNFIYLSPLLLSKR